MALIEMEEVYHTYQPGSPFQSPALTDINLKVEQGEFLGLVGATGSGKSTLIQHLNGLLQPNRGRVLIDGKDINGPRVDKKWVRQMVGMVFQYPEHQLFAETVFDDVAYGPKNLGCDDFEIKLRVKRSLGRVGLNFDRFSSRSPFSLSGGQMRRVALAGVLAMEPEVLVLDEPTVGLDPQGREEFLGHIQRLHREWGVTVILVTHQMEEVARLAQRLVVMEKGRIVMEGTPREIFARGDELEALGLEVPPVTKLIRLLRQRKMPVQAHIFTPEEALAEIIRVLGGKGDA